MLTLNNSITPSNQVFNTPPEFNPVKEDTQKDPSISIDGKTALLGDVLYYRVHLDLKNLDRKGTAYNVMRAGIVDDYDDEYLTADEQNVEVLNAKGEDVSSKFNVQFRDGVAYVFAKTADTKVPATGETVKGDPQPKDLKAYSQAKLEPLKDPAIDQSLLGQEYTVVLPMTVTKVTDGYVVKNTAKATEIKRCHLYGIEYYKYVYALACANMLIHKDGKTNLEQMDSRSEEAAAWIRSKNITKVLMNPPFERKYGCIQIVENVLNSVPAHTMCAFIMPDKKLEKEKGTTKRIKKHHRLRKVIKLPEELFPNTGVTTSIFIFETGVPQDGHEFFACWMKDDGLETVKNKGRHDVHNRWPSIEQHWVDVLDKQAGDDTIQWVNPDEHMSYQMPVQPFSVTEEDFRKTAMDYLIHQRGIDSREFSNDLFSKVMYSSKIQEDANTISITMKKAEADE